MQFLRFNVPVWILTSWILTVLKVEISLASTFDGDEWSEWSDWSPCSRTCDGGITQQFRRCKSVNGCHGVSIRRKMCNMQTCSEFNDYRNEQCRAFNGIDYKGRRRTWEAIEDADNPCALTCRAEGTDIIAKLSQKLRDGTRCRSQALHVCIDGRCEAVGCDLKLGSPKKVDECGVCGGDGSTCSTPVYRWEVLPSTPCSATCGGGQQGVKIICRNSLTNERVDGLLCNSQQKPYRLFQTCNNHPCQPTWKTGEWSECSKTCGGGLIIRKVSCVQAKNGTEFQVADKLCLHIRKPINQETCNFEPCPYWHVGPWSSCSVTCGPGGFTTRNVVCRNGQNLPSSNCDRRLLPLDSRPCTPEESPPCPTTPTTTTSTTTVTTTSTEFVPPTPAPSSTAETMGSIKISTSSFPVVDPVFDPYEEEEDFLEELPKEHTLPLIQPYPVDVSVFDSNAIPSEATNKVRVYYSCGWLFMSFVAEEWGPCSQTCGEGVRRRKVVCKIFLEFSRTIASLPDKECPGPKPPEKESCFSQPCPLPIEREGDDLENLSDSHHAALADSDAVSLTSNYRKTISVGLPPGISHEDMTFSWKLIGYSPCSSSCLGGVQDAIIHCVRDYDQRIATPVLCEDRAQPDIATTKTCNDHACPPRWNVSDFGPCSKPCGSGVMTREVNCIHEVTRGSTVIVPNNICPQPVPRTERLCNTINCAPFWEPGEWGKCSKACGGGLRTRPLYCKQVIALGQVVEWPNPEGHCTHPRPIDYRACNTKPCNKAKDARKPSPSPNDSTSDSSIPPTFVQQEWKRKLALNVKGFATVYQGVFLKLRCPGSGKAPIDRARIVWMKDNHYVHIQTNKIEVVQKSGVLKIKNVTFSDSGVYSCLLNDRPLSNLTLHVQPYLQPIEMNGGSGRKSQNRQSSNFEQNRQRGRGPDGRPHSQQEGETTLFADQQPGVSVPMSDGLEPTIITQNPKTYTGAASCSGRIRPLFHIVFTDFLNLIWMTWPLRKLANSVGSTLEDFRVGKVGEDGAMIRSDLLYEPDSTHWNYEDEEEVNCLRSQMEEWEMSPGRGRKRLCANANAKDANKTEWKVGSWSNCAESRCFTWNTSMQHREVMCTFQNGTITLGSHCNHTVRPEDERECYNILCQGIWRTEPWSPCKSRCDGMGIKVRILKCVWYGSLQPAGNACRSLPRPIVKKACRGPACLKMDDCKDRRRHCPAIRQFNLCHQTRYQFQCCESCLYLKYGLRTRFKKKASE